MLPIVQTSSNNQCTGGLYLKCLFEGGGIKSNPIMFPAPGPPIKVINAMPELPQHHSLRLFCRPSFPSAREYYCLTLTTVKALSESNSSVINPCV